MRVVLQARLDARCETCDIPTPVPGLRHDTVCMHCAKPINIAKLIRDARESGLKYWFGGYCDALAEAILYDADHDLADATNSRSLRLRFVKRLACRCGAALEAPAPGAREVRCTQCGDAIPVRWPDAQTREWDPRITYLIGDAGDRGVALRQKLEGTVVGCGGCGAPLEQRDKRRALVCSHCKAESFLSDAVWTKLYPDPEAHVFHLVYDLDEDGLADAVASLVVNRNYIQRQHYPRIVELHEAMKDRVIAAGVRRALAWPEEKLDVHVALALVARTDLSGDAIDSIDARLTNDFRDTIEAQATPEFISRWVASEDSATRAIGAKRAGGADLEKCAKDPYPRVRAVIARRTDAPPEVIAILRKDGDSEVREHARKNPSFQPGLLTKLFGG
jgi:hypothetical protein